MRLTYPPHSYQTLDTAALPFTFEYANSATITFKKNTISDKWIDLEYPYYNGIVFLTYHRLDSHKDLVEHIDHSYEMIKTHFGIANGIDEQQFVRPEAHVYATTTRLSGKNVATTYQFWATDSVQHFLHGVFYLNQTPNNDSLQPLITYLQDDLDHLLETLRWNKTNK